LEPLESDVEARRLGRLRVLGLPVRVEAGDAMIVA
jgi:hypothetical protein